MSEEENRCDSSRDAYNESPPLHCSIQFSMDDRPLLEWQPADVHRWLSSIGFSQYEFQLKGVSGPASGLLFPDSPQTTT